MSKNHTAESDSRPAYAPRNSVVYLSSENYRKLWWMVRAFNRSKTKMDVPDNVDSIVNRVLEGFFHKNHPDLDEYIKMRDEVDEKAVAAIGKCIE